VLTLASDEGWIDNGLRLRTLRLPDRYQEQDKPERQYAEAGLDADGMVATILTALRHNDLNIGAAG
jgi:1-deoxy-D-xylulose-5-phosphate synthase